MAQSHERDLYCLQIASKSSSIQGDQGHAVHLAIKPYQETSESVPLPEMIVKPELKHHHGKVAPKLRSARLGDSSHGTSTLQFQYVQRPCAVCLAVAYSRSTLANQIQVPSKLERFGIAASLVRHVVNSLYCSLEL